MCSKDRTYKNVSQVDQVQKNKSSGPGLILKLKLNKEVKDQLKKVK